MALKNDQVVIDTRDGNVAIRTATSGTLTFEDDSGERTLQQLGGAGSGDVVGPGSATDNALAKFDTTTGKLIQNSNATLDDAGNLDVTGGVTSGGSGSFTDGLTVSNGSVSANNIYTYEVVVNPTNFTAEAGKFYWLVWDSPPTDNPVQITSPATPSNGDKFGYTIIPTGFSTGQGFNTICRAEVVGQGGALIGGFGSYPSTKIEEPMEFEYQENSVNGSLDVWGIINRDSNYGLQWEAVTQGAGIKYVLPGRAYIIGAGTTVVGDLTFRVPQNIDQDEIAFFVYDDFGFAVNIESNANINGGAADLALKKGDFVRLSNSGDATVGLVSAPPVYSDLTVNLATATVPKGVRNVMVDYTATGTVILTLSTARVTEREPLIIHDRGGGASVNNITLTTEGSETINGFTEFFINGSKDTLELIPVDGNWII